MFETLSAVAAGLHQLLSWPTPLYFFTGVFVGFGVGILPGLGGPAALAFMLPAVIPLSPLDGLVLLTAAASVSNAAGDLTSILVGVPGEPAAVAIVADGHAMARRGEGGRAAGAAIGASLAGSLIGVVVLVALIPLARLALPQIQSPELAMMGLFAVCLVVPLSRSDPIKGLLSGAFGFALSTIGLDPSTAQPRFTFGQPVLWDGLALLPVALGVFAVPEAIRAIGRSGMSSAPPPDAGGGVWSGFREALSKRWLVLRCSAIGAAIGALPGVGATVSQWIAYGHASQSSKSRETFGSGAIDGVIGPAAATTATLGGAMVPTLALGIPGSLTTALLLGAIVVKGLRPGTPMLTPEHLGGHLTLFLALTWCIVLASITGALIGLASIGSVARIARVRPALLAPLVLALILIGTVGERHVTADLGILFVLGVTGYTMWALQWPRAPLMLGLVLGPLIERRTLLSAQIYGWSWMVRPSVIVLAAVLIFFLVATLRSQRRSRPPAASREASSRDGVLAGIFATIAVAGLAVSIPLGWRAGFFPTAAYAAMLILALLQIVRTRRRRAASTAVPAARGASAHGTRIAWLAAFALSAWLLGLLAGTAVSTVVYLRWTAKESWQTTAVYAIGLAVVTRVLVNSLMLITDDGQIVRWLGF